MRSPSGSFRLQVSEVRLIKQALQSAVWAIKWFRVQMKVQWVRPPNTTWNRPFKFLQSAALICLDWMYEYGWWNILSMLFDFQKKIMCCSDGQPSFYVLHKLLIKIFCPCKISLSFSANLPTDCSTNQGIPLDFEASYRCGGYFRRFDFMVSLSLWLHTGPSGSSLLCTGGEKAQRSCPTRPSIDDGCLSLSLAVASPSPCSVEENVALNCSPRLHPKSRCG
jgi:hypothetical protein